MTNRPFQQLEIASKNAENCRCRQPHCRLTPPPQGTPAIIHISLYRQKVESLAYIFSADSMGLSSFKFLWWAPKDIFSAIECMCLSHSQMVLRYTYP